MSGDRKLLLETQAANALREMLLTITDDEEAVRDTIEGSTNLREAIAVVLNDIGDDEIMVDGISSAQKKLGERKARLEYRIERRRAAIEKAMMVGEIQKLELPTATLSLRKVAPAVVIEDEAKVPGIYFKLPKPVIDKTAIKIALENGTEIRGATLTNGSMSLLLRRI